MESNADSDNWRSGSSEKKEDQAFQASFGRGRGNRPPASSTKPKPKQGKGKPPGNKVGGQADAKGTTPAQQDTVADFDDASLDDAVVPAPQPVKEEKKIEVPVSFAIPDDLKVTLEKRFTGYRLKPKPGATSADHPVTACERAVVEQHIVYRLHGCATVIDIGGNPNRHKMLKHSNVHVCNPPKEPKDYVDAKFHKLSALTVKEVCQHEPLKCKCVVPEAFMSLYTLQGASPTEIMELVHGSTSKLLIAAFRDYSQALGSICEGEISYTRDETHITMKVVGDNVAYKIDDDSWLFNRQHHVQDGKAIAWKLLSTFGDTKVFCFTDADATVSTDRLVLSEITLLESLTSNARARPIKDPRGPFTKDEIIVSKAIELKVDIATAISYWNWVIFIEHDHKRVFYAPKGAINEVRLFVAGKNRDPILFASAVQKAKEAIKKYAVPEELMADSVFAIAATAFYTDVEKETAVLAPLVHKQRDPVRNLSRLLTLKADFPYLGVYGMNILITLSVLLIFYGCKEVLKRIQQRRSVTSTLPAVGCMHWLALAAYILAITP